MIALSSEKKTSTLVIEKKMEYLAILNNTWEEKKNPSCGDNLLMFRILTCNC